MIRLPPYSTLTYTLFPDPTLFRALPASPLLLPVPRAHVVGASVTEHEIQGVLAGHVFAWPADHDSKLAFIIDLLTGQMSRNENRIAWRSEEHTSELQSLMRISYAVFCLTKKNTPKHIPQQSK